MRYMAEGVVTGFTKFKGAIDGQEIDANTVFIEVDIGSMGKGLRTAARKCADESVLKKIEHNSFPFKATIVLEEQATAKKESMVVVEIRPQQVKQAA